MANRALSSSAFSNSSSQKSSGLVDTGVGLSWLKILIRSFYTKTGILGVNNPGVNLSHSFIIQSKPVKGTRAKIGHNTSDAFISL
jgi:hypothetical protein